jgi:CubicO group peptidase (beta-lactamase class C family)
MDLKHGTPEEAGCSPDRVQRVRDRCQSWMDADLTPCILALAARRGVIFLHEAWGVIGAEEDAPAAQRDTIFGMASISKTLTVTALMLLVEAGKVGLDRPVQDYLPEFKGAGKEKVWVRHLATHTSGLRGADVYPLMNAFPEEVDDLPPLEPTSHPYLHREVYLGCRAPLWREPGTQFEYCSFNTDLIAEIIRKLSGQSFNEFTRQRIFEPLGMTDTWFSLPVELQRRAIRRRYVEGVGWIWPNDMDAYEVPQGSSACWSTPYDMAIFGQTFLNGGRYGGTQLLSPLTVRAMTRDQIPRLKRPMSDGFLRPAAGLGWFFFNESTVPRRSSLNSPGTYMHTGGSGSTLWVDPENEIVGVFFFQKLRDEWRDDMFINAVSACVVDD